MSEKIAIFGTGYVGLVTGVCLASVGNNVTCVDINEEIIEKLRRCESPIYEPQLDRLLAEQYESGRIQFITNGALAVQDSKIIMIAVGTPMTSDGSANLESVFSVAQLIGENINGYKVVATKSTVPPGTGKAVEDVIRRTMAKRNSMYKFHVVSNPEFLKEGNAVNDFLKPDRIVIGSDAERARKMMEQIYRPFMRRGFRVIFMDRISAELTKYFANAMLATRISLMNEFAKITEGYGGDIETIRQAMGADPRIGSQFLYPGPGYGGSCFPKDVRALMDAADKVGVIPHILDAVDEVNMWQREYFVDKICDHYDGDIAEKTFAVWGLAFKAGTDDVRESPATGIIELLIKKGAFFHVYDPQAMDTFAHTPIGQNQHIKYVVDQYDVLKGAHALLILTEWPRFRSPRFATIKRRLIDRLIFDARNLFIPNDVVTKDVGYISIGRMSVFP